jgi:small basic protein (TIGR04137 family)
MSLDRSLKIKDSLTRHRNVLTRVERITKMMDEDKFDAEQDRPLGLPKMPHRKTSVGGKQKEKKGEVAEEGTEAEPKPK